ncbi:MAG: RNA 2',3'-cyclic phosphodiesterase [Armatimonadota bacterium]|nr:RNA 2',3'-cyclic phosphodiesterase [Armatimonadota bacterium]MDR7436459.1 RNA 2',3'-cyclic phosphodiesterase [Armatimonadota bacterium]MDR7472494.1 RNA 2',3'-cyclic phosphodiesterase [Armatimonadota bacterium]MDR7505996.1 RNA 2',3'-cyclic phosphodiesterase [Armatimonadota bacterium]MDR7508569.1 RNA 2',3'-cyclic phosphodiesterase [Armatimonadota bacterium]
MTPRHRIFIAVELDPALHDAVVAAQRALEDAGARIRWVKPASLHFTLRFLGEITPAQVALAKIATREAARGVAPFAITLRRLGAFPSLQRPQVVWVGVEDGAEHLDALARRLDERLARYHFPPEDRRFRPHLTLARVRDARQWGDVVRALTRYRDVEIGTQTVRTICVMESTLTPQGPVYTRLEEVSLETHEN